MLGRQVTSLLRRPLRARLVHANPSQRQYDLCIRALFGTSGPYRATPGRPEKAVGEPSRTIKRAVKHDARKLASATSDTAAEEVAANKKKPQKKKATAAPKKTPKPKKVLTEKQRAKKERDADKLRIERLKETALKPPRTPRFAAYDVHLQEQISRYKEAFKGLHPTETRLKLGELSRETSASYRNFSAAELEHYNHLAHTRREASQAEYKRWVESHSPEQIYQANKARRLLNRRHAASSPAKVHTHPKYPLIKDERAPKRAVSGFAIFTRARHVSGDLKNISLSEASKLIGQEWRALSEDEKKKYIDQYQSDRQRYASEFSTVYGHPHKHDISVQQQQQQQQQPQAASAAA